MPRLVLTFLGGLRTQLESGEPLNLPTRKALALVAYLALPVGQPHSRDELAALLWGGGSEDLARNSFRQALFGIRKALAVTGQPALVLEGPTVILNKAAVDVDVAAFEREAAEGTREALQRAADLYRGDLLAGLAVQEPPFEEWLQAERERLRELVLQCLDKLLIYYSRDGATELAIQTALRWLAIDPLQETVYRSLMGLYVKSGRRGSALRQYQLCVSALQRELGVEPEAETKALYQQILRAPLRRHPDPAIALPSQLASDTVLVGRQAERSLLGDALDDVMESRGRVTVVLGEEGIGKTRLMAELSGMVLQRGGAVLVGRAYESEQVLPFGPWADALRAARVDENVAVLDTLGPACRAQLRRLIPEVDAGPEPGAGESDYRLVFESVLELIRSLAVRQPLAVILEDLHWADHLTVRLAAFLGHRMHDWPVLLVVTAREEHLGEAPQLARTLDELAREPHVSRLVLSPLTRADTEALVRALSPVGTGSRVRDLAAHVWAISDGNPFVATEAMRAADGDHTGAKLTLPERVREMVQRRLERLDDTSQHVLAIAAVIGRDFEFALLQRASGLDASEAAERVDELVRRRVIHGVGERLDFVHNRIRETAEGRLLAHRRAMLHQAVAGAIEHLYADSLEPHDVALGTHYRQAGSWERGMMYSGRAGLRALSDAAHNEAVVLIQQTLDALDHLPGAAGAVPLRADLLLALAQARYHLGDLEQALAAVQSLDTMVAEAGDPRRLRRCLEAIAFSLASLGKLLAAREAIERAAATMRPPDASTPRYAYQAARVYYGIGDYRRTVEAARFVIGVFQDERRNTRRWRTPLAATERFWLMLGLAELGKFPEALEAVHEALEFAEATRYPIDLICACLPAGRVHVVRGDLPQAITTLERVRPLCRKGGDFSIHVSRTSTSLGLAYALSGRADGLALLREAVEVDEALRFRYHLPLSLVGLAEGYLLAGDADAAERHAAQALHMSREHGHRGWEAWALRLHGEIARHRGETAAARDFYREASSRARELGMRPLLAHCHRGLACVESHERERATHLRLATKMYDEMGMEFWLAHAQDGTGAQPRRNAGCVGEAARSR